MARKSRVEAWDSTPFVNYVFGNPSSLEEYESLNKEMREFHFARYAHERNTGERLSCVDFAKKMLGRQDYTWCGEFRNWVWERGNWRLFVNNTQGFSFEVREDLEREQVLEAWKDVRERLGVA